MSLNIAGAVINTDLDAGKEQLESLLGRTLSFQGETNFESASTGWVDDGNAFAFSSEGKTLILLPMDDCSDGFSHPELNVVTFAISEISMAYHLSYSKQGETHRRLMVINEEEFINEGEALPLEQGSDTAEDIILAYIKTEFGTGLYEISEDQPVMHFQLLPS